MKIYQLILTFGLFFIFISCNVKSIDQKAEAEKLMELSREWALSAQKDDLERTLNYWAKDAILIGPDQPALKGHDEILKMLQETSQISGFEVNWEPKEAFVSKSGDLGYVIAHNYFKFPDSLGNIVTTYGMAVEIWKRDEDGTWKNSVDIFNSDPSISSIK
jgi:ketosteroid isomerase-like protein